MEIGSRCVSACAGILLWLLGVALPAEAQEPQCRTGDDLRCWYLVGGLYEAPRRIAYLARHVDPSVVGGKRVVELIQVIEPAEFPERYAIWRMHVDCDRHAFLVESHLVADNDGILREKPSQAPQWSPLSQARYGEVAVVPFTCDKRVVEGRSDHIALFVGNAYRAPDVVNHFRQVFWQERGRR